MEDITGVVFPIVYAKVRGRLCETGKDVQIPERLGALTRAASP